MPKRICSRMWSVKFTASRRAAGGPLPYAADPGTHLIVSARLRLAGSSWSPPAYCGGDGVRGGDQLLAIAFDVRHRHGAWQRVQTQCETDLSGPAEDRGRDVPDVITAPSGEV